MIYVHAKTTFLFVQQQCNCTRNFALFVWGIVLYMMAHRPIHYVAVEYHACMHMHKEQDHEKGKEKN